MKAFKSVKAYKYFSDGLYSEQRLRTSSGRSSHRERTLSILFEQKAKTTCTCSDDGRWIENSVQSISVGV